MHTLRELMEVSAYVPTSGYSLDLAKMAKAGLGRAEALEKWVALGRTEGSFYRACKVLKDDLVRMAFLERKTSGIAARMEVWEKWKVVNQLLIVGKKRAAVTLGTELVGQAQKVGNMEVLVGVSSFLEVHFGGLDLDTRRWLRYRKIRKDAAQMYEDELWVKALQARVVMGIERGRDLVELEGEIADLSIKNEGSVTYLRFRLSALAAWYERKGETAALLTVLRETMMAYEVTEQVLPEGAMINLQFRMTPIMTRLGRYGEAELNLSKALEKAVPGTQNWHLFMLQKACLGFESGKPAMALAALKLAQEAPREHNNPDIDRRWGIVEAILGGKEVKDAWKEVLG